MDETQVMQPTSSPLRIFRAKVERGELEMDPAQLAAARKLDVLYHHLSARPVARNRLRTWLRNRFAARSGRALIRGLYLWGGVGTGKTLLMDLFHQSLPERSARRIHFHRFMQSIHEEKNRIEDHPDPLGMVAGKWASQWRVLCLDEFSVTDITDAMILSGLLRHLFQRDVVLVTTSNIRPQELYRDGLQRDRFLPAIELLENHTITVQVDHGKDYRMAHLRDAAIYHIHRGEQTIAELRHCFDVLAGAHSSGRQSVVINDRMIEVCAVGHGVIWFEFSGLCRTHRSKVDFIEIARQYHTVILSDIPQLTATMDDAARRLIELVDELYDRNVNLIVSAACLPDRIYVGKRLVEPFKRTASRLLEMSSGDYLSAPHLS